MIAHIYKPRRNKDGKVIISRLYRGRYRLHGDPTIVDVALNASDKQVAERKLAEIINEREREKAGLIAPKLQRTSAQKPILSHLEDFVADLAMLGRCAIYQRQVKLRVRRIVQDCGWQFLADITLDGFVAWRSEQRDLGPKTLNEYLNAMTALLNWMERHGRIANNPLARATRVDTRGKQQRRRAFTDAELTRLLAVAGKMRSMYLAAAYTGLRAGELQQLVWGDLKLDGERPHIVVRAITAKNRREAVLPIHPELLEELRKMQRAPNASNAGNRVFPQFKYPSRFIRRDMEEAGIARFDEMGRRLDFHCLRYTFATKLAQNGVSQRLAQELLRHSDPRLTANIYTDVTQLPTFEAVTSLPRFSRAEGKSDGQRVQKYTQLDSQSTDAPRHNEARSGTIADRAEVSKVPVKQRVSRVLSFADAYSQSLRAEGIECPFSKSYHNDRQSVMLCPQSATTQLNSQDFGAVCPFLSKVIERWFFLPHAIRFAIDALVNSQPLPPSRLRQWTKSFRYLS